MGLKSAVCNRHLAVLREAFAPSSFIVVHLPTPTQCGRTMNGISRGDLSDYFSHKPHRWVEYGSVIAPPKIRVWCMVRRCASRPTTSRRSRIAARMYRAQSLKRYETQNKRASRRPGRLNGGCAARVATEPSVALPWLRAGRAGLHR
jgi:hypothetical protein